MTNLASSLSIVEGWMGKCFVFSRNSDDTLVPVISKGFEAMELVLKSSEHHNIQRALRSLEFERVNCLSFETNNETSVRSLMYGIFQSLHLTLLKSTESSISSAVDVAELQRKVLEKEEEVAKLTRQFEGACREARTAQLRAEHAEGQLDDKRDVMRDNGQKAIEEFQKRETTLNQEIEELKIEVAGLNSSWSLSKSENALLRKKLSEMETVEVAEEPLVIPANFLDTVHSEHGLPLDNASTTPEFTRSPLNVVKVKKEEPMEPQEIHEDIQETTQPLLAPPMPPLDYSHPGGDDSTETIHPILAPPIPPPDASSADSHHGDDESINPVLRVADTRVERSINEPSFDVCDSAHTPIQEMNDTALAHDMPLNDLANDEMFSGGVDPSFNEDNTIEDISSSVEVIDCGLSIDSRNGDDEYMNLVMGDADTRVERSINEPSFVIRDSAHTPICELGDANLEVETVDDPILIDRSSLMILIDRELAHRLYPDSAFINASMEFNERMAAFRANDSNNDLPPRVEEVGSGDGHDETMANDLIGREGESERTNGNTKDQVNEGRRSSRVASRAQKRKDSEGEDKPTKKKPRSEAEKVRNSSSKSSSQPKSLLRQAIKVTHKCVRCERYPHTIDRYVKHLRNSHGSTLSANGIYLKCACGLQVHHEVLSHSKRCDGRHFTVHKVDED